MENILLEQELEKLNFLIEEYRKIYVRANRIGQQIEDLQTEMVKVTTEMSNIASEESHMYTRIADRCGITPEEAQKIVLEELQKNMNQVQN